MSEKATELWAQFCRTNPQIDPREKYQTWFFGDSPELAAELTALVLAGTKTATASLAAINELNPPDAPILGGYSIITDFDGAPRAVLQTTEIRILPFDAVDADFARDEGEGDLSLDHWRTVHRAYFQREAAALDIRFDEQSLIACERFKLCYAPEK